MKIREILVLKEDNEDSSDASFEKFLEKNRGSLNIPLISYMLNNNKFLFSNALVTYGILSPPSRKLGPFDDVVNEIFRRNSVNVSINSFELRGMSSISNSGYNTGNLCYVFPMNGFNFFMNKNNNKNTFRDFINYSAGEYYKSQKEVADEFLDVVLNNKKRFLDTPKVYFFRTDIMKMNENSNEKLKLILTLLNKREYLENKKRIDRYALEKLVREFLEKVILTSDDDMKNLINASGLENKDGLFKTFKNYRKEFLVLNSEKILDLMRTGTELVVDREMIDFMEEKLMNDSLYRNNVKGLDPDFIEYLDNYIQHPVLINGSCLFISHFANKKIKLLDKLKEFIQ